jgi:hypothetical protein
MEFLILLISLIFSGLFLADTYDTEDVATGLLPNIVAAVSILFCLVLFVGKVLSVSRTKSSKTLRGEEEVQQGAQSQEASLMVWWGSYLTMVGYFALILLIGLLWATLVYTLMIPFLMHYRRWKVVLLAGIGVTLSMYVAFCVILRMNLPSGILF